MIRALERFIKWSEHMLRLHERGDEEALNWAAFFNLTAISFVVILVVLGLNWWLS